MQAILWQPSANLSFAPSCVQKGKKKAKKTSKLEFDFSGDTREGERPWDFSWALQNTLEKNYDVPIPLSLSLCVCACVRRVRR